MADTKWLRAATLDRIVVDDIAGVDLRGLPPFTTLLVWTMNSLYRVAITRWPEVYIQGGDFFPDPTAAYVEGPPAGGVPQNRLDWHRLLSGYSRRRQAHHHVTGPRYYDRTRDGRGYRTTYRLGFIFVCAAVWTCSTAVM